MSIYSDGAAARQLREALRLYGVTGAHGHGRKPLLEQVELAMKGGVTMIQLREKELGDRELLEEAGQLRLLTRRYHVPLIINDRVDIALACDADGVHVGQTDMDIMEARRILGPDRILGVTAKTVDQALLAQERGADYLGCGAVFGSATKPDAKSMTLEVLGEICRAVSIPVVAIGGITGDNVFQLKGTGAAGAAVVSGIFDAEDICTASADLCKKIEKIGEIVTAEW